MYRNVNLAQTFVQKKENKAAIKGANPNQQK